MPSSVLLRGGKRCADIAARAPARIADSKRIQLFQRFAIGEHSFGLPQYWRCPSDPEPIQIFEYGLFEFGFGSGLIDIFDPKNELSAFRRNRLPDEEGGVRVTQMKMPGRRWREPLATNHQAFSSTNTVASRPMPGRCSPCSLNRSLVAPVSTYSLILDMYSVS